MLNLGDIESLLNQRGLDPRSTGTDKLTSACPVCNGSSGHCNWGLGKNGGVLVACVKCKAKAPEIVEALGITVRDLMPSDEWKPKGRRDSKIVATYDYTDVSGRTLYQVVRFEPKDFRQRRPDHTQPSGWAWNLKGVERVLYRQPEVVKAASEGKRVLVVEGEKDADNAVARLGLCATTAAQGAGNWGGSKYHYAESLAGAEVIIVYDKDPDWKLTPEGATTVGREGQRHACDIYRSLAGRAKDATIVSMPDRNGRRVKDLSDWLDAGGTPLEFQQCVAFNGLVDDEASEWVAAQDAWFAEAQALLRGDGPLVTDEQGLMVPAAAAGEQPPPEDGDPGIPPEATAAPGRQTFDVARNLEDATTALIRTLSDINDPPTLFIHADGLHESERREDGSLLLRRIKGEQQGREILGRRLNFRGFKAGELTALPHAPKALTENLLSKPSSMVALPYVAHVVRAPAFGASGSLLARPGYYPDDNALVDFAGFRVPAVPDNPSAAEIAAARDLIFELLCDVPFDSEASRAAWIAALLTFPARRLFDGLSPFFVVEATTPGTGKGLLVELLGAVAIGNEKGWDAMHLGRDEVENDKQITAVLAQSPTGVVLDNLPAGKKLESPVLAKLLTSRWYASRLLGTSTNVSFPNNALWMATGNNLLWDNDLVTRILPCRLTATCERPRERTGFRHPLPSWAAENRPQLVAAMLTMVRAWIVAGRPAGSVSFGSFQQWASCISGILEVSGINTLMQNRNELQEQSDEESAAWRPFVLAWHEEFGTDVVRVGDLADLATKKELLADWLRAETPKGVSTKMGHALKKMRGRIFGQWRISPPLQSRDGCNGRRLIDISDESESNVVLFRPEATAGTFGEGSRKVPASDHGHQCALREPREPLEPICGVDRKLLLPDRDPACVVGNLGGQKGVYIGEKVPRVPAGSLSQPPVRGCGAGTFGEEVPAGSLKVPAPVETSKSSRSAFWDFDEPEEGDAESAPGSSHD